MKERVGDEATLRQPTLNRIPRERDSKSGKSVSFHSKLHAFGEGGGCSQYQEQKCCASTSRLSSLFQTEGYLQEDQKPEEVVDAALPDRCAGHTPPEQQMRQLLRLVSVTCRDHRDVQRS